MDSKTSQARKCPSDESSKQYVEADGTRYYYGCCDECETKTMNDIPEGLLQNISPDHLNRMVIADTWDLTNTKDLCLNLDGEVSRYRRLAAGLARIPNFRIRAVYEDDATNTTSQESSKSLEFMLDWQLSKVYNKGMKPKDDLKALPDNDALTKEEREKKVKLLKKILEDNSIMSELWATFETVKAIKGNCTGPHTLAEWESEHWRRADSNRS
ncbi:MAG: hypothetical protein Q9162_001563 [Coniocarpon cinnabarinum]